MMCVCVLGLLNVVQFYITHTHMHLLFIDHRHTQSHISLTHCNDILLVVDTPLLLVS